MKEENKDVFKEFQESIKGLDGSLHILETNIPVEKQMEYFKFSDQVKEDVDNGSIEKQIEILNSEESSFDELKYALTFLAVSGEVKAYRELEIYNEKEDKAELKDWKKLALIQARITLESEFSDEKQIFISTGLGGKGSMIRFFSFFKSSYLNSFSSYQRDLIEKEMSFAIHKYKGILEKIEIENNYFTLLFLIDIHVDIRAMLLEAVRECNQYGDFIDIHFIITNVKIFDQIDIRNELVK